MRYSRLAGFVAIALISAPLLTSALTLDELNREIATLLSQVAALQQKIAAQASVSATTTQAATDTIPVPAASCPQLSRTLGIGAQGDDVRALQQFLIRSKLLAADSATGYFGVLTQGAVQNWQSAHGIVVSGTAATTGFGAVGARTRGLIARICSAAAPAAPASMEATSTVPACLVANPPVSICNTGWKPVKDTHGCTVAYDCATPLPVATTTRRNCTIYSRPACAPGYVLPEDALDLDGCPLPISCVAR